MGYGGYGGKGGRGKGYGKGGSSACYSAGGPSEPPDDRFSDKGRGGGFGKGKGGGKGGGGKGGGGKGKPFWRQFVDASEDPEVIAWCRKRIEDFVASGSPSEPVENLPNAYRNTLRHYAPEMGCGWQNLDKGVYALVRCTTVAGEDEAAALRQRLVAEVKRCCVAGGGKCKPTAIFRQLSSELVAFAQATLRIRNLKELPSACAAECAAAGVRLNERRNAFLLEGVEDDDAALVSFNVDRLREARAALEAALAALPPPRERRADVAGWGFLLAPHPPAAELVAAVEREVASAAYVRMVGARSRLPAFAARAEVCAAVRETQVTLVLGATGCGKSTQVPQLLMEEALRRGEPCRILASQPRRISAISIAERVASERGGALGARVGYKVRFEDSVAPSTALVFCTVGILLRAMQSNASLDGATHVVVDEVHERDVHTDFLLMLLRRALRQRPRLKLVLMSATVDPSAFQAYFPSARTVTIPGKTNYPIEELFLEDILPRLPMALQQPPPQPPQRGRAASAFGGAPLPGLPLSPGEVAAALPRVPSHLAPALARAHAAPPDDVDLELVVATVQLIHATADEGAVLVFVPGWFEIGETLKRLEASAAAPQLRVYPLHSRMPTAEQRAIFEPPPAGTRKVIVSTVLAETSVTIEDVVYVVDSGKGKSTFLNEASLVSALRTTWYAKANGMQRRGRAGRCRPGVWYRLYTSLQWAQLDEYALPEMQRAPLEELCLEVASLRLGAPAAFLAAAISPPKPDVVAHAVAQLFNLGAVADDAGAQITPLGDKLAGLAVHPMLGKLILLGGLFRCVQPLLTVAAALGYKSPFLCPLGKEREANEAKRMLAAGSDSDHWALVNAYAGWVRERGRFANRHFLSHQSMDYINRLRNDLSGGARELLSGLPADHADPAYLADVTRAVLVAGLYPNLAQLRRFGKGETLRGLKVAAHPGSVNSRASGCVVVFYDVQETTDRYMYDCSQVQMAPCLLFAPRLREIGRTEQRVTFGLDGWRVAVAAGAADELLAVRALLLDFVQRAVGQPLAAAHYRATDALNRLFSEHAQLSLPGDDDDDDEDDEGGTTAAPGVQDAGKRFRAR